MRRLAPALLCSALLLAAACSDEQAIQPAGPSGVNSPASATGDAGDASDSTRIVQLIEGYIDNQSQQTIQGLFGTPTSCTGNCNAAMKKFEQIADLFSNKTPPYDLAAAQSNAYDLINWTLSKWKAGELNDPPGDAGVTELVNLLFSYSGIQATICNLGEDCDITYFDRNSPPTTLQAPSGFAQLQTGYGSATVQQPTILSVYRLTPDNDPTMLYLATQLDQYPLQYEFNTSSGETFLQDVTLTVCLADNVYPPNVGRLRLAHNVAEPAPWENIQILPSAGDGGLDCTNATPTMGAVGSPSLLRNFAMRGLRALTGVLSPTPLQATMLAGSGITGTSKNLSPFGIVDPEAYITSALATNDLGYALTGQATATAPKVKILTPNGTKMSGDSAIFTITGGGGSLTGNGQTGGSVVVYTDANGEAAVGSWTLGTGTNTLQVTGAISPCDAPVATDDPNTPENEALVGADCGTVVGTVTFTATGVPPITDITSSPDPLPAGIVGVAYPDPAATFAAVGGTPGNYAWSLGAAAPSWLSINSSTGQLRGTGTPLVAGTVSFPVTVTSGPTSYTESFSITVAYPTALSISFDVGPSGCYLVNQPFSPPIKVKVTTTTGTPLPVPGVPVNIVAVLNNGSWVQVSGGSKVRTGSDGVATFSNLSINKAGGYQLRAYTEPTPTEAWPNASWVSGKFKVTTKC